MSLSEFEILRIRKAEELLNAWIYHAKFSKEAHEELLNCLHSELVQRRADELVPPFQNWIPRSLRQEQVLTEQPEKVEGWKLFKKKTQAVVIPQIVDYDQNESSGRSQEK